MLSRRAAGNLPPAVEIGVTVGRAVKSASPNVQGLNLGWGRACIGAGLASPRQTQQLLLRLEGRQSGSGFRPEADRANGHPPAKRIADSGRPGQVECAAQLEEFDASVDQLDGDRKGVCPIRDRDDIGPESGAVDTYSIDGGIGSRSEVDEGISSEHGADAITSLTTLG